MNVLKFLAVGMIAIGCVSCGKSKMTPVSERINGPLKDYFEVVVRDYAVNKDGKVGVEIKRIKAGFPEPWQEGLKRGYGDGYFNFGFSVEFQDADGNTLCKDNTSDHFYTTDDLEAISHLEVDESSSIMFSCRDKSAKQFKIGSSFQAEVEPEQTVTMTGAIGKYPIVMTLHIAVNRAVTGAYYYERSGRGNYLYVKGRKHDDQITLEEFTKTGEFTGEYEGIYKDGTFSGNFQTKSGNYDFELHQSDLEDIVFSHVNFASFSKPAPPAEERSKAETAQNTEPTTSSMETASSNSEDWDALLDSYEKYVDKTISFMKKSKNGDMTAMKDYLSSLEEAQSLENKMKGAQGNMSAAQWSRYMKILGKLASAAQEMQ